MSTLQLSSSDMMAFRCTLAVLALAAPVVFAQSPPEFSPAVRTQLSVRFGDVEVDPAGKTLQKSEVPNAPTIDLVGGMTPNAAAALVAMVDFSVHASGGSGNTTLVHWVQPDLSIQNHPFENQTAALASYIPPNPPAGQTHTYGLFLFAQPEATFQVPSDFEAVFQNISASTQNRRGFDLGMFAASANLGAPLAANYFLLALPSNTTGSGSSATPGSATSSATPGGASSTGSASSTGAASSTPTSGASSSIYATKNVWLGAAVMMCVIHAL